MSKMIRRASNPVQGKMRKFLFPNNLILQQNDILRYAGLPKHDNRLLNSPVHFFGITHQSSQPSLSFFVAGAAAPPVFLPIADVPMELPLFVCLWSARFEKLSQKSFLLSSKGACLDP